MLAVVYGMSIGWFGMGWESNRCRFTWFGSVGGVIFESILVMKMGLEKKREGRR